MLYFTCVQANNPLFTSNEELSGKSKSHNNIIIDNSEKIIVCIILYDCKASSDFLCE